MPLIGTQSYNIDFYVLESNDPKTIVILDRSNYLDQPELPLIEVIIPGFTGFVQKEYIPNGLIVLNSDSLDLTEACEYETTADLPDGVYQITMKVCPYDELYNKKCYLKTTKFYEAYQNILLNFDIADTSYNQDKLKQDIIDLDILIQSAKAEVNRCNVDRGTQKYQTALRKLLSINRKLNCE